MFVGACLAIRHDEFTPTSTWEIFEAREEYNKQEIYLLDLITSINEYQDWNGYEVPYVVGDFQAFLLVLLKCLHLNFVLSLPAVVYLR